MEAIARLKNSPFPPRKMRLLADLIRGMRADKALFTLKLHEKKYYAIQLEKLLLSAVDDWKKKNSEGTADEELYVKSIMVDGGRVLKRMLPAPQGRANRVRKRSNHITITIDTMSV